MLAAEAVAQFRNDFAGAKHILEFAGAVQRNGAEHNVIVERILSRNNLAKKSNGYVFPC